MFRSLSRRNKSPTPAFDNTFRAGTPYSENEQTSSPQHAPPEPPLESLHYQQQQRQQHSDRERIAHEESSYTFLEDPFASSNLITGFMADDSHFSVKETPSIASLNNESSEKSAAVSEQTSASSVSFSNSISPRQAQALSKKSSSAGSTNDSFRTESARPSSNRISSEATPNEHYRGASIINKRSPLVNFQSKARSHPPNNSNNKNPEPPVLSRSIQPLLQQSMSEKEDSFTTPYASTAPSIRSPFPAVNIPEARFFHSRRVQKGNIERPWTSQKDPKEKWVTIIPIVGILVGLALAGLLVWDGLRTVVNHTYCPVYMTDFSNGLDERIWQKEAEVGGFGNGQFEETTVTDENVFIKDGMLHIRPTLQDANLVEKDNTIDLRKDGICSSQVWSDCITSTNTTNGTIIQPVKSGRISTKKGASIKYGRIEVTAKLPTGDWLWPAIWMLPVNATYGKWPLSGEIDIMESRGNDHTYPQGGNNIISSTLHWGPDASNDAWWRSNSKRRALHNTFADKFHTYGLEWSEKYIFTYLDNRLGQVMYFNFDPKQTLWQRGDFPIANKNGTQFVDPWSQTGRPSTPFDQDFYLIINVAVGGTNGWFQDGQNDKPWVDGSPTAKKDFWNARDKWLQTWQADSDMQVQSVKMWQQAGYNGCK